MAELWRIELHKPHAAARIEATLYQGDKPLLALETEDIRWIRDACNEYLGDQARLSAAMQALEAADALADAAGIVLPSTDRMSGPEHLTRICIDDYRTARQRLTDDAA